MSNRIVILADESARWIVAGLTQLDRLFLSIDECARELNTTLDVAIFWRPGMEPLARGGGFTVRNVRVIPFEETDEHDAASLLLSTHVVLQRHALREVISAPALANYTLVGAAAVERWDRAAAHIARSARAESRAWFFVAAAADIPDAERWLLAGSGKSQDGVVSRTLNRPISRAVSRQLLRFPVSPTTWTLSIFVVPFAAAVLLLHGGYVYAVAGLLLFQLYSVLDGCDGEIARAKFAESINGGEIDRWCDTAAMVLMLSAIGFGHGAAIEGTVVALLVLLNEGSLALRPAAEASPDGSEIYPRHREMLERSGLHKLGDGAASFLVQMTKRDVAIVFFVLLAIAGRVTWILHIVGAVTVVTLLMQLNALRVRETTAASD